jgi:hypothetical protein
VRTSPGGHVERMSDDPTRPDASPGDTAPPEAADAAPNLCPDCGGSGRRGDLDCPTCDGTGTVIEPVGGG